MFKKMMMLFLMGFSVSVFADENLMGGDRVGNGGDVVVCGRKVELLDIYEARLSGYETKKPEGKSYQEMLKFLLQKNLQPIQPKRTAKYLKFLESFEREAQFLPGIQLSDVDDAGMVAIPKGCILKQIAIQLSDDERPAGKKRYTVSLDLWNKLDEYNKMSLILHEIIYREAIENKSSNSMVVRATVGEILKTKTDLDIFLSLVASFSNFIEYKIYTWETCKSCRPIINLSTNEYNEQVLKLENVELIPDDYSDNIYMPTAEVRVLDGKILDANKFKFLRAGKSFDITNEDNQTFKVTSDQDIDYRVGVFYNTKNTSIYFENVENKNYILDFKNVNKLRWENHLIQGQFDLQYKGIILNDPEYTFLTLLQHGEIVSFGQKNHTTLIKLGRNILNCHVYESKSDSYKFDIVKDCIAENSYLEVTIAGKKVGFSLLENVNSIYYSDETGAIAYPIMTVFAKNAFLVGLNKLTNQNVFLQPGKYQFAYDDGEIAYTITDERFHYTLYRDGSVAVRALY